MTLDSASLGRRVAEARGRASLTQAQLAAAVGLDRSSLAKVESGERRVSALELARIAGAVDARIEWFVSEPVPAIVSHRNNAEPGAPSPQIDAEVERRVEAVEFVASLDPDYTLPILPVHDVPTTRADAEALARNARQLLGLNGTEPLADLGRAVARAGVVPFVVDLGPNSADAASVLLQAGAVTVINGSLAPGRRRLALAHEIAHVLVADDYTVDWRVQDSPSSDRRESLFDAFARALLLPEDAVRQRWDEGEAADTRSMAVRLASEYRVDFSTLARRLLDIGLVDAAGAARVRGFTTTRADIVEMGLLVPRELEPEDLPEGYVQAVLRLYRREWISPERALELLMGVFSEPDLPQLPKRQEQETWQFIS